MSSRTRSPGRRKAILLLGLMLAFIVSIGAVSQSAFGALVDNGFESGTDGASLVPPWVLSGSPQRYEYDNAQVKVGALSGWIKGPTTSAYAGVGESSSAGMTADTAELRFWAYFDSTNQYRRVYDASASNDGRAFFLIFYNTGTINFTQGAAAPPAPYVNGNNNVIGTYTTGWTEFRIVMNFTNDTVQVSKRAAAGDPWTQLKKTGAATYDIPMTTTSANVTQSHGTVLAAYQNANLWIDEVRYADGGMD